MQLDYKDIIIKHYALLMSGSEIARQTGFSKSGVNDFLRAFKKCEDLNYPLPAGITVLVKRFCNTSGFLNHKCFYAACLASNGVLYPLYE